MNARNPINQLQEPDMIQSPGLHFGVHPAVVTDLDDPEGQARIQVRLPWAGDEAGNLQIWARYAALSAGDGAGAYFLPDVGSEVLVAFEAGNMRRAYVIGALWNGRQTPPETMDNGSQNLRQSLTTRAGSKITLDDGTGSVRIETPDGHSVEMSDDEREISLKHAGGGEVVLTDTKIQVNGVSTVEVTASTVEIGTAICNVRGVLNCETLVANTAVSSPVYTPGAGNIW